MPIACALIMLSSLEPVAHAATPLCGGRPATRVGTAGDDVLRGTAAADVFVGKGGNDRLIGRGGDDLFCAGAGDDVVKGGSGADELLGKSGADRLFGGPGDDTMLGGPGNDLLDGGDGTDVANGGDGTDDCPADETRTNCETPEPELDLDGAWAGQTSQAKPISFTIAEHALTLFSIAYAWSGQGCSVEGDTTIEYATPLPIDGTTFDIQRSSADFSLTVHGEFTSDTAASGTFSVTDTGDFCPGGASGTWSATKA
jgi:hypothetical protein